MRQGGGWKKGKVLYPVSTEGAKVSRGLKCCLQIYISGGLEHKITGAAPTHA